MRTTRRGFLRLAGAASVGSATLLSGTAAAEHADSQPDHVTIEYDQAVAVLEEHRPRFVFDPADRDLLLGQYGWLATSSEYDTDACVYWLSYGEQEGVTPYDSHPGDHEPVYVFVDSETGEFREVVGSIWHWSRGRSTTITRDQNGHPTLRVVNPWHHYTAATESGELLDVKDLTAVYDSWLANGMEDDLEPGVVRNPWRLKGATGRDHWWRNDIEGIAVGPIEIDVDVSLTALRVALNRNLPWNEPGDLS